MPLNALDTVTLLGVKQQLPKFEPLFLTLFFPEEITFGTEEIAFDKIKKGVRLAPFVSPMVAGRAQKQKGGKLLSFVPAYVKPTDIVRPDQLLRRRPGEAIGGNLTAEQRRLGVVTQLLIDQEQSITHREEWMAVQSVVTGKVVVEGHDYPQQEVDFGRDPNNNIALVGAAKWDDVGLDVATYDPSDDLEDWAEQASGTVDVIVMDKKAWRLFSKFKAVKDKLDTRRGSKSEMEMGPQLAKSVMHKGFFGEYEILVYAGKYDDPDTGTETNFMPDFTLVMGPSGYEGVRAYGAIQDAKALTGGLVEASRYPKNWFTDDPSVENIQTQSAPLMVTPDADAFVSVKVGGS